MDPWDSGVLDRDVHVPLVRDLDRLAMQAGIHPRWVCESMKDHVGPPEVQWAVKFRKPGAGRGLVYLGSFAPEAGAPVVDRCSALCGMLMRNFIDARVRTPGDIVDEPGARAWSCLLLPNFCPEGVELAPWKRQAVGEVVTARAGDRLQTVLYAPDFDAIETVYGRSLRELVARTFVKVTLT